MMGKFYIYSGGGRNPSGMVLPHFDTTLLHLCNKPETGLNTIMSFQKRRVKNGYGPCISAGCGYPADRSHQAP